MKTISNSQLSIQVSSHGPNYAALSLTEKNIYGKLTLPFGNVILPCYFPS